MAAVQSLTVWKERVDFKLKSHKKVNNKDWKYVSCNNAPFHEQGQTFVLFFFFFFPFKHAVTDGEGGKRLCRQRLTLPFPPLRWRLSCIYTGVCIYFSTGGVQLSSQLVDVWSAFSSGCLQNFRGWKLSFLSGRLSSLFACCPMLTPLCRQLVQKNIGINKWSTGPRRCMV